MGCANPIADEEVLGAVVLPLAAREPDDGAANIYFLAVDDGAAEGDGLPGTERPVQDD